MADDEILDVTGQPGGPPPEVQAVVDAEQAELVNSILAARAPAEAEQRRILDEKMETAIAAAAERRSVAARLNEIEARLTALEGKP